MRVGVELMMTNISVAKSSLLPSKMMHGTWMRRRVVGVLLTIEVQRREAVLAVDDEVLAAAAPRGCRRSRTRATGSNSSFSAVNSSTVPGIGGWLTAVS